MKRSILLALLTLLAGCGRDAPPPPPRPAEPLAQPAHPEFVGKVWVSTTRGHALGTMLIFLPDRTLVMDSCHETYRLTQWGVAGKDIRWLEDTVPIQATVEMPSEHQLVLRIAGIREAQSYVTASVPYVCPDMPR